MSKINKLDQTTINQIAAGEVVERPASVVKELVENSIDSGATAITVEVKEGGITFIRITDNGSGIQPEDIRVAFLRHATSKIRSIDDLQSIASLGFRGEALSSVAAVAQVEMISKVRSCLTGIRYCIEGGEEVSYNEIGCPEGTTILIRNLFFNTPARKKFLKSEVTEAGYIGDIMERLAISHPDRSIKFINNNKIILNTSGNGNRKEAIYHVYGRDTVAHLLLIEKQFENFEIKGFVAKPVVARGNRNHENYFINGRYVRNNIVNKAIEEAYRPYMMQHKYPFTVLDFTIPPSLIDINVHPAKLEVRFSNQQEVYDHIYKSICETISEKSLIQGISLEDKKETKGFLKADKTEIVTPEPFETNRWNALRNDQSLLSRNQNEYVMETPVYHNDTLNVVSQTINKDSFDLESQSYYKGNTDSELINNSSYNQKDINLFVNQDYTSLNDNITTEKNNMSDNTIINTFGNNSNVNKSNLIIDNASIIQETFLTQEFLTKEAVTHHKIIGQLFQTYWLVEYENQLYIIDQHAAHEKVIYEKLMKNRENKQVYSQQLNPPIILSLNLSEENAVMRYKEDLKQFGYEIESFGGREYAVSAIPSDVYGISEQELLTEFIDLLSEEIIKGTPESIYERIASISCKAAVKGNHNLSRIEAEALIGQLLQLDNPFHCPHGRPTIVSMTKQELERKFKRIV